MFARQTFQAVISRLEKLKTPFDFFMSYNKTLRLSILGFQKLISLMPVSTALGMRGSVSLQIKNPNYTDVPIFEAKVALDGRRRTYTYTYSQSFRLSAPWLQLRRMYEDI